MKKNEGIANAFINVKFNQLIVKDVFALAKGVAVAEKW